MAKAKAKEAPQEAPLERVVVGPKSVWGIDPKTGNRREYKVGETIFLPPHQAKSKARYLQAPEVAKALAAAKVAEDVEAEREAAEVPVASTPTPTSAPTAAPAGGDSSES